MHRWLLGGLMVGGVGTAVLLPTLGQAQMSFTGTVERVWEDGLRLNTGDRTLTVDTWDVYGDNTPSHVSVQDEITITGEFEGREFDAFTITGTAATSNQTSSTVGSEATVVARDRANAYTGTVERVWEDGFRLNTGDRTLTVDSWDLYGDNTPSHVAVGDRVTITGEFEDGEFDVFTVQPAQ